MNVLVYLQAQKKDQSKFYGDLLEKRRTEEEKDQQMYVGRCGLHHAKMENVSLVICKQCRPRSACVSMQSDQDLHCPRTESLATTEFMESKGRGDTSCLGLFEGTFSKQPI